MPVMTVDGATVEGNRKLLFKKNYRGEEWSLAVVQCPVHRWFFHEWTHLSLLSCGPYDLLLDGIRDDEMPQSFSKRREERKSAPTTVSRVIHVKRGKKHREDSSWEVMRRRLHLRERYYVEV